MSVEDNKARIRFFVEQVVNAHDLEREKEVVVPELLDEAVGHLRQLFEGFPDVHATIDDLIGEGDKVVGRVTLSGTHRGPFAGAAPTNKRVSWTSIRVWRFENGKVVESWAMQDRLGLLTQLGLVSWEADSINWAGSISAARD
jgi:predicted ester cyclase